MTDFNPDSIDARYRFDASVRDFADTAEKIATLNQIENQLVELMKAMGEYFCDGEAKTLVFCRTDMVFSWMAACFKEKFAKAPEERDSRE